MRFQIAFLIVLLFGSTCASKPDVAASADPNGDIAELRALYEAGDVFRLRDRVRRFPEQDLPEVLFFTAAVEHAFNGLDRSNALLDRLLAKKRTLPDSLLRDVYRLRVENELRRFAYRNALDAARAYLDLPATRADSKRAELAGYMMLLKALADVPVQQVSSRAETMIRLERDRAGLHRIPVRINGSERSFVFDTGAGLSVLTRSEAEALGMKIRQVGYPVPSATGARVKADIAVADRLELGSLVYQNVVFLVFPDEAMSFPQANYHIPGIIGFPVIAAAGEVRIGLDDHLFVPAEVPERPGGNLALRELSPRVLTRVELPASDGRSAAKADSVICTLDTGANRTEFLSPFYERYQKEISALGKRDTVEIGGAGGMRNIPVYTLPSVEITTGGISKRVENTRVRTSDSFGEREPALACNIGQDVLADFKEFVLNFRSMTFTLSRGE